MTTSYYDPASTSRSAPATATGQGNKGLARQAEEQVPAAKAISRQASEEKAQRSEEDVLQTKRGCDGVEEDDKAVKTVARMEEHSDDVQTAIRRQDTDELPRREEEDDTAAKASVDAATQAEIERLMALGPVKAGQ